MAQNAANSVTTTIPVTYTLRSPAMRVNVRAAHGITDTLDVTVTKERTGSFPIHISTEVATLAEDESRDFEGEGENRIVSLTVSASNYGGGGSTVASFTVLK